MEDYGARLQHPGKDQLVPFGATDEQWLTVAGKHGWIAITRNQRIRYRPLEKRTLMDHGVAAFAFTGGQVSAPETALVIVPLLAKFERLAISEPHPFLYSFGITGRLTKIPL